MATNPFEDEDRLYQVLVNAEVQYSLWPNDFDVPAGWKIVHGPDSRQVCLSHIDSNWSDMRPKSLIAD